MGEAIFALFLFVVSIGVLVVALILPIVALVKIRAINERLLDLRAEVRELRRRSEAPPAEIVEAELVAVEEPASAEPALIATPPRPRRRRPPLEPAPRPEFDWSRLEAWLGIRGLGWAAVVLLLFTGAFFLKLVIDEGWIDELGRIVIGVGLGSLLVVAGWWCQRRGQNIFCQMLTAGGIALLYLCTFASFGFYHLLPRDGAAPFLIVLVAEAFALAALYNAPSIAIMAVVGGLLTPFLLESDTDQYPALFTYLVILNAGVAALSVFRRWWIMTTLALVGTHLLFWGWYDKNYHPAKLSACLAFHGSIFALYLGQMLIVNVWRQKLANIEDLVRNSILAVLVSLAGYVLLDPSYHAWLGSAAVGMAIVYALLAGLVNRYRLEDAPLLCLLLALAMAFVATVFPLQAKAVWIAVGWAVQGLALWWFGLRIRAVVLYGMGAVFLLLALIRLLLVDTLRGPVHDDVFVPLFNNYGLPATMVALCVLAAAVLQRRTRPDPASSDFVLMRTLGVAGVVTLWIICSIETYDFFIVQANLNAPGVQARLTPREREMPRPLLQDIFAQREEQLRLTARMSLSAVWAVFALALIAIGLRLQNRPLRWLGLGLFAVTLIKVMAVDTDNLRGIYRVGAFFALSLMMAAGAWAYQKLRKVLAVDLEK